MAKRHLTRKEIKQPDQFVSSSVQLMEWTKSHVRYFLYGMLGILAIVGVLVAWSVWQKQRQQQAEILLYEAVKYSILMVNAAIRRLAKHWPNFNVLQRSLVRHPRRLCILVPWASVLRTGKLHGGARCLSASPAPIFSSSGLIYASPD